MEVISGLNTLTADIDGDGVTSTQDAYVLLRYLKDMDVIDGSARLDVNGDGSVDEADVRAITDYCAELGEPLNAVKVPTGGEVTLTARIQVTAEDSKYLDKFPNGQFVEGYLYAHPVDPNGEGVEGVTLSMPLLGFYGDWSKAPLFDHTEAPSLYSCRIYAFYHGLNTNPYITSSLRAGEEFNAFSQENFLYELDFGLLRGAKRIRLTVKDAPSGSVIFTNDVANVSKSYYSYNYGRMVPAFLYGRDVLWAGSENVPDGTQIEYLVEGWSDDGDEVSDGGFSFKAAVDTTYPTARLAEDSFYRTSDGKQMIRLELLDNRYIAAVLFVSPQGIIMGRYEVENEPGVTLTADYDITGYGSEFKVVVADCALNESEYDLELSDEIGDNTPGVRKLESDRLYGSETYSRGVLDYGWFSLDKKNIGRQTLRAETFDYTRYYSAEYINGHIIAQNVDTGELVVVTPNSTYWPEQTLIYQTVIVGKKGSWCLYDMALDYKSSTLYAVGWEYAGKDNDRDGKDDGTNYLYKINFSGERVKLEKLGKISGVDTGTNLLTLACDNNGRLYGVDNNANFYKVNPDATCERVGKTVFPFTANVIQSMTWDHGDNVLYWGAVHSDGSGSDTALTTVFYKVDPATGECEELGSYGHAEPTGLFVPTETESDIFTMGAEPSNLELDSATALMIRGQTRRQEINWLPWSSTAPDSITWKSGDTNILTVDEKGMLTAVNVGTTTVSATATVGGKSVTRSLKVRVVPSAGTIYSYMVIDYSLGIAETEDDAASQWIAYPDIDPKDYTEIGERRLLNGKPALLQGGAYCNGYVYVAVYRGPESVVYCCAVEHDGKEVTAIGDFEKICTTDLVIGNMGVDYPRNRIIFKELSRGGLGTIDIDSGDVTFL